MLIGFKLISQLLYVMNDINCYVIFDLQVNSMRTATPTTPIMQMHQKQIQQSQSLPQPPTSTQQASQHKRIAVGMMPPHMQLPQFQSAQQQQQQQAVWNEQLNCHKLLIKRFINRLVLFCFDLFISKMYVK